MPNHSYGHIPSKPDARDYALPPHLMMLKDQPLPVAIDLRHYCSPVRDQGQLGSCTGFAIAVGMREFLVRKTFTKRTTKLSPLWLYYQERVLEDSVSQDAGAEPRDGFKTLLNLGVCTEGLWKYDINKFADAPGKRQSSSARHYKIQSYHRMNTLLDLKACLAGGYGAVIGFTVYESFESDANNTTGQMPMPSAGEQILGGHATFVAGYTDNANDPGGGRLIVKNSWSTAWGDQGYFYMPYAYVTPDLVSDIWTAL